MFEIFQIYENVCFLYVGNFSKWNVGEKTGSCTMTRWTKYGRVSAQIDCWKNPVGIGGQLYKHRHYGVGLAVAGQNERKVKYQSSCERLSADRQQTQRVEAKFPPILFLSLLLNSPFLMLWQQGGESPDPCVKCFALIISCAFYSMHESRSYSVCLVFAFAATLTTFSGKITLIFLEL